MKLVDTHCHLCDGRLADDVAGVLARASQAGVAAWVCVAGSQGETAAAIELADRHEHVYFTAGLHPHEAKGARPGYLAEIRRAAGESKNVAIGEIGLDYHYDLSPRQTQRRVFAEQLDLAGQLGKPVVVHTREAFDDTLAVMAETGFDMRRAVFHCFTDGPEHTRRAMEAGAMVSFSGIVTFKKADDLRRSAALIVDDRLLIETDSPYLSPEPMRKMKINEPANVVHVAARLAEVRGTSAEAVAELTTANAVRFFGLAPVPDGAGGRQ